MKTSRYLLISAVIIVILSACLERSEFPPQVPKGNEVKVVKIFDDLKELDWCITKKDDIQNLLEFLDTQKDEWFIWPKGKDRFNEGAADDKKEYPYTIVPLSFNAPDTNPQFNFGFNSLREIHGECDRCVRFKSITSDEYHKLIKLTWVENIQKYPKYKTIMQKDGFFVSHCK